MDLIFGRSPMDYLLKNLVKNNKYNLPMNPTDEDIYKYFGITKEEQQSIEEVIKDLPKLDNLKEQRK